MKKYIPIVAVSLLVCLFIYVFYRTEKTLINQFVIALLSKEHYTFLKASVNSVLPLQKQLIYSLPEGLWVFCITLTSSFFYLGVKQYKCSLVILPIIIAYLMELFQLWHLANGRFDWVDLCYATGFWLLALFCARANSYREPLLGPVKAKTIYCMLTYSIVYLAHVTY